VSVVIGWFDPLLAEHATRLAESAQPGNRLIVAVTDPPDPLLPARARAELVAALGIADAVVTLSDSDLEALPPSVRVLDQRALDRGIRSGFIAQVGGKARVG
jgi:hypothetical protein